MCVKNRLSYHENKIKVSIQQLSLTFNMLHWFKLDCVSTVLSFPSLHSFLLRYQSLKKFKISFVLVCIKPSVPHLSLFQLAVFLRSHL